MYVNKCTKCGAEFETKNPKRVICPSCLYPDRKPIMGGASASGQENQGQERNSYSHGGGNSPTRGYQGRAPRDNNNFRRPYGDNNRGGYNNDRGGYNNSRGGYNNDRGGYNNNRPGYSNDRGGYNNNRGGYNNDRGGYNNNRTGYSNDRGGYNRNFQGNRGGFNNNRRPTRQKSLLISREQVAQIEVLYKRTLPLPNPDIHEVIGQEITLEPTKVFFGINLVRQKMKLPKLPYPKRKLAVSPDQLMAVKNLYEPLLPLPPIGCHKIIAAQLKMDEWRVHVGIGLIRKQMDLPRWNADRDDVPEELRAKQKDETKKEEKAAE